MTADLLTGLLAMITRPPESAFSILAVMRHGTHEKQLSNIWAWLLNSDGSHHLGDGVQRILIDEVNRARPHVSPLPYGPYGVRQEQNTGGVEGVTDIADIVLENATTSLVIENYYTSDGHGHGYETYAAYGARDQRQGIVVLLCETEVRSRLADGWEQAPVLVYTKLLDRVVELTSDRAYVRQNPEQAMFIANIHRHFTKRAAVQTDELIEFMDGLCRNGGVRYYGARDQDSQAIQFADTLREAAITRYVESREMLARVKLRLRDFCAGSLLPALNEALGEERFDRVKVNWQGQWQYDVSLMPPHGDWLVSIAFGPTASAQVEGRLRDANLNPDYTRLLVYTSENRAVFSSVGIGDLLDGLAATDRRLQSEVLGLLQ